MSRAAGKRKLLVLRRSNSDTRRGWGMSARAPTVGGASRQAPDPHRAPEDAVQHDQPFLHVAVGPGDRGLPALEQLRRDVLEPELAQRASDQARSRAVGSERRRLAVAIALRPAGRPRPVHAGPIRRWTCRPSGSRYLAYHCGPRRRSTRKTWPEISCKSLDSRDIFGTRRPEREKLAPPRRAARPPESQLQQQTERRRNRTFQPPGYDGLPVLKTGWATRPVPLRRGG